MLFNRLRGFVAAAEQRSISRAAEQLFLSQPALTSRLHALEAELGVELLVRNARGVELSDMGKAFLPHAQRALEAVDVGRHLVHQLRDGLGGNLSIAAAPALSTYVLPPMLKRFRAAYPAIGVTVRTGHSDEIVSLILRDEVQLGLACDLRHPELDAIELLADELVLVAAPDHAAASHAPLTLEELGKQQIVVFRTSSYDDLIQGVLRNAAVSPLSVMEFDSIDATKKMVENGLGVAFLPHVAVADDVEARRLVTLALVGMKRTARSIVALRRRGAGPPRGPSAHFLSVVLAAQGPAAN